jgi:hypothetical protein
MPQTKWGSFIEALVNVAIGFFIGVLSQHFIFPLYGINIPFSTNFELAGWFTIISIARTYLVRRYYNWRVNTRMQNVA